MGGGLEASLRSSNTQVWVRGRPPIFYEEALKWILRYNEPIRVSLNNSKHALLKANIVVPFLMNTCRMGVEIGHVAISRDLFCNHPFAHFYVRSFTIWKFTPNGLIACMRVFCLDNREVVVEWMDISPFAILKWWFLITYFKIFDWNERLRLSHVIIVHLHFYTLRHI